MVDAPSVLTGRLKPDGTVLNENGVVAATKCAVEPVWFLPGIAKRFGLEEATLRRMLFEHTGGMFPEVHHRRRHPAQCDAAPAHSSLTDGSLPPATARHADRPLRLPAADRRLHRVHLRRPRDDPRRVEAAHRARDASRTAPHALAPQLIPHLPLPQVRVHDECNGSDVFGSDICTCRPYLIHGIEECIRSAQEGGAGLIVYFRKEGRALGEVTKFMVYNARKRQQGGDSAQTYFKRTEMIAGVQVRERRSHAPLPSTPLTHPAPPACRTCASRS